MASNSPVTIENKKTQIKKGFLEKLKNEFIHGKPFEEMEEDINTFLSDYPEETEKIKELIDKRTSNILNINIDKNTKRRK